MSCECTHASRISTAALLKFQVAETKKNVLARAWQVWSDRSDCWRSEQFNSKLGLDGQMRRDRLVGKEAVKRKVKAMQSGKHKKDKKSHVDGANGKLVVTWNEPRGKLASRTNRCRGHDLGGKICRSTAATRRC